MTDNRTTERYEVDGFEVAFVPWHSEYLNESFVAVYVFEDGREVLHAGMTKIEPSEDNARKEVEHVLRLRKLMEVDG